MFDRLPRINTQHVSTSLHRHETHTRRLIFTPQESLSSLWLRLLVSQKHVTGERDFLLLLMDPRSFFFRVRSVRLLESNGCDPGSCPLVALARHPSLPPSSPPKRQFMCLPDSSPDRYPVPFLWRDASAMFTSFSVIPVILLCRSHSSRAPRMALSFTHTLAGALSFQLIAFSCRTQG